MLATPDALDGFEAEALENLRDRGLEVLPARIAAKGHNYIGKTSTLEALELTGKNLRGQRDTIATWVDGTFRALADALRDAPMSSSTA